MSVSNESAGGNFVGGIIALAIAVIMLIFITRSIHNIGRLNSNEHRVLKKIEETGIAKPAHVVSIKNASKQMVTITTNWVIGRSQP